MDGKKHTRKRIVVEVEDQQLRRKLQEMVPWGLMKPLVNTIMADVISTMEESKHPRMVLAAIISEDIKLADYLDKEKQSDVKHTRSKEKRN